LSVNESFVNVLPEANDNQNIYLNSTSKQDMVKENVGNLNNVHYDNKKYEEYQKMSLKALENGIEEMCTNKSNVFIDKNLYNLDNQINEFIDNFFDSRNNLFNPKDNNSCFGCSNPGQLSTKTGNDNSEVLHSLVEQLNELEKMLHSTKNELLMKKRIASKTDDLNQFLRNDNNFNCSNNGMYNFGGQMNLFSHDNFDDFNLN
jgi:hypothetical protein